MHRADEQLAELDRKRLEIDPNLESVVAADEEAGLLLGANK
ncbi:MAG: hypothetical protein Q4D34_06900 [Eggerthellaceae bacterium]|nr:hypothetical protein [Eggerthellaceae bacterium]